MWDSLLISMNYQMEIYVSQRKIVAYSCMILNLPLCVTSVMKLMEMVY